MIVKCGLAIAILVQAGTDALVFLLRFKSNEQRTGIHAVTSEVCDLVFAKTLFKAFYDSGLKVLAYPQTNRQNVEFLHFFIENCFNTYVERLFLTFL